MELLKEKMINEKSVKEGNIIKVDNFLNHQIDVEILNEVAKEFKRRFENVKVDKILTIEASGIAIAAIAAQYFNVPVVFAKKTLSRNLDKETYETMVYSFTKQKEYAIRVSKRYLNEDENILIVDDFMAEGRASEGLIDLVDQAGGHVSGVGIVIEKGFQDGGKRTREKGINLQSLVIVDSIVDGKIIFR